MITIRITGPRGVGKTTIGRAIEEMLIHRGMRVVYETKPPISREGRNGLPNQYSHANVVIQDYE